MVGEVEREGGRTQRICQPLSPLGRTPAQESFVMSMINANTSPLFTQRDTPMKEALSGRLANKNLVEGGGKSRRAFYSNMTKRYKVLGELPGTRTGTDSRGHV